MKKAHNEEIHIDGGEQGHKCEFCEKAFFRKESVRRHIREAHEGKLVKEEGVIYECGQCEKKYERRDVLRRHVRLVHEAVQVKEALLTRLTRYVNFMNFDFFFFLAWRPGIAVSVTQRHCVFKPITNYQVYPRSL